MKRISAACRTLEVVVAAILFFTGVLKIWSSFGKTPIMQQIDPLIPLNNATLYAAVGLLELGLAAYLIEGKDYKIKTSLLLCLMGCFSVYRLGRYAAGILGPCACLGSRFEAWPWLNDHLEAAGQMAFWTLLLLTIAYLCTVVLMKRKAGASEAQPTPKLA